VEVCVKTVFLVDMAREPGESFGIEVEAELADDAETEDMLQVFVDVVTEDSPTSQAGIVPGDELLTINGQVGPESM